MTAEIHPLSPVLVAPASAATLNGQRAQFGMVISMAMIPDMGTSEGPVVLTHQPYVLLTADSLQELRSKVEELLDIVISSQGEKSHAESTVITDTIE